MLDALPYIRSRASTKIMTDIITDGTTNNATINEWLFIMAFVPRYVIVLYSSSIIMEETEFS